MRYFHGMDALQKKVARENDDDRHDQAERGLVSWRETTRQQRKLARVLVVAEWQE
jgi:hypothetical protein